MKLYIKYIIVILFTTYSSFSKNNACSPDLCSSSFTLGRDTAICIFPYVLRTGLPCASHEWSTGASQDSTIIYQAGTYFVKVIDGACIKYDTIRIYGRAAVSAKQTNIWYFGTNAGLDFNKVPVQSLSNTIIQSTEGSASLCDSEGNLLFYTDGKTVWDKTHNVMLNGTGLLGDPSATHAAIIVPIPQDPHLFYIFTCPAIDENPGAGFNYSIVDIRGNNGLGEITSKNNLLFSPSSEKVAAVRHANGTDVWVIAHESNSKRFLSYLVTKDSISKPFISTSGSLSPSYGASAKNSTGQMKLSADGKRLLVVNGTQFELYEFNNTTGAIFNMIGLAGYAINSHTYGCEFSPDGTKIYLTDLNSPILRQYDISSGFLSTFIRNDLSTTGAKKGGLQLASDGKIYVVDSIGSYTLGVINNPNALGLAADYRAASVSLPGGVSVQQSLPTFMQDLLNPLNPDIAYTDTCVNTNTQFIPINFADSSIWSWGFENDSISNVHRPYYRYTSPGIKTVSLSYKDGCTSSGNKTIIKSFHIVGPVLALKDTTVCILPITLHAGNTGAAYLWSTGDSTESLSIDTIGHYGVKVILDGCMAQDSLRVDTLVAIPVDFTYSDTCFGSLTKFLLQTSRDTVDVTWSFGDGNSNQGAAPKHEYLNPGPYQVVVSYPDTCGRDGVVSKTIHIIPADALSLSMPTSNTICQGELVIFTADSIKGAGSSPTLEWRVNGVKRSTGRTFATTVLKDKDSVSVYVVSDAVCTFPKSAETNKAGFTVTPLPQPKLQPYILFCREEQDSLVLDASTPGIIQYIWSTLATTPKVAIQEAGDYQVKVIDTNGCTASVQTRVVLSCEPKVSIPSAFTPNGDGKNDELQFFPLYISSFNIQIFNRWGELIFNSDDPQTGWDGTYKGDRVPQGVYNYICTYVGLFKSGGDKRQLRGDVTVLE